ncbi:TonB-dependent receptor [Kineobactrum sediminis]|uniref:TonB-dependent receptor n=1 Tax=Kineobactrum sediminis TaxID=1905677 RepID=A0A2N5Y5E7_9GAMM|nr:TonB-dependent receptor [Kineobactrum sediminis]PLW83626.1 TonB-dependent receptor [Kineobactrum sediminis]
MKKLPVNGLRYAVASVVALSVAPPVFAQSETSDGALVLEEITVTARRRDESIQQAPYAVTAFSAQTLEDANIQRMADFIALTPNVTLATSQGIGTSFLSIRGLTQVRNGEAPVATIVDGVLQFSGIQFRQELFDVESVQVVKGPQGAIYGRNATGGAIIINTRRPTNETDGYFSLGVGEGDEYSLEGSYGGALIENKLFAQVSGKHIDREGYLTNITRNEKADRFEDTTLRGRMIFEPTENLSFDARANLSRHKGRGIGFQFQGVDLAPDGITAIGFGTDTGPFDANNVLPVRDNNVDYGERDVNDLALKIDWTTELGTLVSTTSYTDLEEWADSDQFPYTAAMSSPALFGFDGTQTGFFDIEAWSQEFRFRSPDDQPIRWEVGVYYLEWDRFVSLSTGVDTGAGIIRLEREPSTDPRNPSTSFLADDNSNTAKAIFGQSSFDIGEDFELSLALRYDEEERVQDVSPLQFPAGVPGARNQETFDMVQPKITLRYSPSTEHNWYTTWGRGFRSGQFNQNGISELAADIGLVGLNDVVDQEESESFEVGYKGLYLNDRLRLIGAGFATKVEGQQFFSFVGAVSAQILTNIDEVQLYGGELELNLRATEHLDLYASVGYTDSEIEEYAVDPSTEGNEAPYVAKTTFNLGGQYEVPLNFANLNLFARLDYERRGSQYWDVQNSTERDPLDFLSLRLGVTDADDKWSLIGQVENALDEEYNSEWVAGGFSARAPGRIWNLRLRYNF